MEFKVLGPVELVVDGHVTPLRSTLQRTLLGLLLAEANRVVSIERIIDALWGSDGWADGHQRLWFHVSKLRGRLSASPATLERSGPGYLLGVEANAIDAHRFTRLVDHSRRAFAAGDPHTAGTAARQALALWRGDPYADIAERAVGQPERIRLAQLHLTALETWVEAELRAGRTDVVLPELEKLIIDHPYREGFHGQLMRALWMQHRPSEALAVYASTRRLLDRELGVGPSPALRELAARIAAGGGPGTPVPASTTAVRPATYGADMFVGREAELAQLGDAVAAAHDRTSARLVRGQAGAGKTSLLRTLIARAESTDPALVGIHAVCHAGTGPLDTFGPFRAIARLLDGDGSTAPTQLTTAVGAQRLRTLAPRGGAAAAALDAMQRRHDVPPAGAIGDLLRQMVDALVDAAPVVLVIDDLHWADEASVDVIRRLVTQVRCRLTVVAAYRQHDLADARVLRLERDLQASTPTPVVIDLDATTDGQRRAFIDALLDREPNAFDEPFRGLIARRSEGHALFAVELIDELRRRGVIRWGGRCWEQVDTDPADAWPARVHAVLGARFERLDDATMALLRAASVEGETFTTAIVADLVGRPEPEVIADLSHGAAAAHDVVTAVGVGQLGIRMTYRYRFRHNLFQRFVYDALDPVERSLLHRRVAATLTALTADHGDDEWAVALARHHEAAGDIAQAVRELGRAAQRAVRLAANAEAVTHVERALQLLARLPAGRRRDELEAELHMHLGVAQSIIEGFAATTVEQTFERAAALMAHAAPEHRFPALFGLWVAAASRADMPRSGTLADELTAAAESAGDDGLRVMALHARWTDRLFYGDLAACLAAVEASRELYRHDRHHPLCYRYGNHDAAVCAFGLGAVAAALGGDSRRAARLSAEACALADVLDHRPSRVQALALAAWVLHLSGDPDETAAAAERALALEADGAVPLWFGLARFLHGRAGAIDDGDAAAIAPLEHELRTQRDIRTLSWMPVFTSLLADAYLAAHRVDDALRVASIGDDPGRPLYRSEIIRVRAEAAAQHGRTEAAVVELTRSVDDALASGASALALRSALALARVAPAEGASYVSAVVDRLPAGHRSRDHQTAGQLLGS